MLFDQPVLHTPRLVLRPFELSDARTVQNLAGSREIADTTLQVPHPYPDNAAESWIRTHAAAWTAGTLASFAITARDTSGLLGCIGLNISPEHACAELGYWVGRPFWSQGYCTEAGRRIVAFGFETLRLNRIHAHHLIRNPASGRVLEKLGLKQEGILREAVRKWGCFEDMALFAILASEWSASRQ